MSANKCSRCGRFANRFYRALDPSDWEVMQGDDWKDRCYLCERCTRAVASTARIALYFPESAS